MSQWYAKTAGQTLSELDARRSGLSPQEAQDRLERYGPNKLAGAKKKPLWARFLDQMRDPMILVLLAAAALSLVSSGGEDWIEAVIILVIVVVNACISISQEDSAEKALEALQKMSAPLAKVVRGGEQIRLETDLLVPGDIIVLEAGDLVPADARILECANLKADESAMTGESVPVNKQADQVLPAETVLGDRSNMAISSTVITNGRALCVVTDTGMDTEVGRIAGMLLGEEDTATPLQRKLAEISKTLSFVCLAVCAVMFGVGMLYHRPVLEMLMAAVSLAVAAIPEGLPAIVTIVLALGVQRMVKHNAIVKKLPAVETLGCAGVICSDKTGTLTQNRMTVQQVWTPGDRHRREALTIGALCNDTVLSADGKTAGDPTETAFVDAALLDGLDKNVLEREMPRAAELPFDSDRKLMSTVHPLPDHPGKWRVMVKGAPDVLLSRCTHILAGSAAPLTAALARDVEAANASMGSQALRVLACGYKDIETLPSGEPTSEELETGLTFVGLVGMIDPPRMEVKAAVEQCYAAGIRPVMITGDHKLTAVAIAKELDIFRSGDLAITGEDLDFMPQELLEQDVDRFSVYARVSPEHKMRIVKAWQKKGMVVAMTGDGVNDAPALKVADIGCAMGITGTDVAKGAADMILTDDNFATIVKAVEQGRGIYSNIKKAIHYLLSCNIGEIVTLFLATLFNFHQPPLVAVQLLWLNLVTDSLPALALGMEPVEPSVMEEKPRPAGQPLFTRDFSIRLAWQGLMVGLLTLGAYWLGEYVLSDPSLADATANTMAFATLTFCQLFHAFDVRSERQSIAHIGLTSNPAMNKAFLVGMALQLAVLLMPPLMNVFRVCALSGVEWLVVLGLSLTPLVVCEIEKAVRRSAKPS
ncbi:MAG: calcium-translocating P-type ATPase, PMCA-type [Oscillospiraceae bacterium]|nr:calcium-translocating P-type ATPase, PMCA-type [Oscillospiraceae bacterium]MCI9308648.1 calcium-translocating P-type ATPase, PMCA-type [Oscillospiraceae bacterium]